MRQRESRWHRKIAAVTVLIAVWILWFTLYRSAAYPPPLDVWLAIVGALFLGALTLLHRIHAREWPGIARCGFLVSVFGLSMWVVGGTMSGLAVAGDDCRSTASRFMFEVLRAPQAGWGLFCAGLMPIGAAAVMNGLSLPMRLLLPLGGLLLLGPPLKYVLGERAGGLAVLVLFGVGWLAIGALLVVEHRTRAD